MSATAPIGSGGRTLQKTSRTGYFPKTDLATTIWPWIGLVQSILRSEARIFALSHRGLAAFITLHSRHLLHHPQHFCHSAGPYIGQHRRL